MINLTNCNIEKEDHMVHPPVGVIVGDERFCRWGVFGARVSQIHVAIVRAFNQLNTPLMGGLKLTRWSIP
jgi:hypothetical protein